MEIGRRGFLIGLAAGIVAPSIVRATSLMPVKVFKPHVRWTTQYLPQSDMLEALMEIDGRLHARLVEPANNIFSPHDELLRKRMTIAENWCLRGGRLNHMEMFPKSYRNQHVSRYQGMALPDHETVLCAVGAAGLENVLIATEKKQLESNTSNIS